ncbi:MAG: flagellar biosynthesis anti-sigma factor FlgM [Oligoflexales bacterium]
MSLDRISSTKTQGGEALRDVQSSRAKEQDKRGVGATDSTAQGVGVQLSNGARELQAAHQKAYDIAMATPDVREYKIASLKEKIKNGTYKVDAGKVADGMLREAIKDKIAAEFGG